MEIDFTGLFDEDDQPELDIVEEPLTPEEEEALELYYDTRPDNTYEGYLRMYGAEDRESVLINLSSKNT